VLENDQTFLEKNISLGFDVCSVTGDGGLNDSLEHFHNDTVLAELLLDQNDLFLTADNKVTTRIDGAFVEQAHFLF